MEKREQRGSLTVEYTLCMFFASLIMFGVVLIHDTMTTDVAQQFKSWVVSYPDN